MQRLRKDQLSHKHQQDADAEIGIEKVLQTGQEEDLSRVEREIEIIPIISAYFFNFFINTTC